MTNLKAKYSEDLKKVLQDKFQYKNPMMVPSVQKVVISMGVAEASKDKNAMQNHINELSLITGQKPVITKTKQAISNFKTRKGQPIGLKVTLRGKRMYDFIDRFCNIIAPRIRDFRGFVAKGDKRGSYSLGIDDQQIFPELNLDQVKRVQGMNITFVTSGETDEECIELLRLLGMPFKGVPVVVQGWI